MDTTSKFEMLPDELLIAIFTHDLDVIPRLHQKTLTQICLVSKHLRRVAHEILLTRPYVRAESLNLLHAQYRKYLDLAFKVKTLELVSPIKQKCLCHQKDSVDNNMLQSVRQIESLFTVLPHLDTLLLGSNHFSTIIPLHTSFLTPGLFMCPPHGVSRIHHYGHLSPFRPPTAIIEALGRLKVLELPVDWNVAYGYSIFSVLNLTACSSLEHLTIPTTAFIQRCPHNIATWFNGDVDPSMYSLCPLPQSLLKLTLSRNGSGIPRPFCEIGGVMKILALQLRPLVPRLTDLEVWSRSWDPTEEVPASALSPQVQKSIEETVPSRCASLEAMGINVVIHYESRVMDLNPIADLESEEGRSQDLRYIEYDGLVCRGYFRELGIWGSSWRKIGRSQYRTA